MSEESTTAEAPHIMANGIVVEGDITVGKETRLTAKEQGQLARGEIDENLEPTGKEVKSDDVRTLKSRLPLFRGKLTVSATAAATGEPVSVVFDQVMPTTEEGIFYHLQQYHPSAIRDTMKIDPENKADPTLRTSLEK